MRRNRKSDREEIVPPMQLSFFCLLKQEQLHMRLRRKLNVYVFVTTAIST